MKILMVNKFLFPNGGSETYIFDIGKQLIELGHEVQYFGMDDKNRIVGNHAESYTSSMNFRSGGIQKILYPFKIIYSTEARKKIRTVLDDYRPEVVHLNNINFQITPSIIYEIRKWEKQNKYKIKIIYTAHDFQWVCPNHMLMIPSTKELCFKCKNGKYGECAKNKCIHNSVVKSALGSMEAFLYRTLRTYEKVDMIICPSYFMKSLLSTNSAITDKLVTMHNYCTVDSFVAKEKKDYVLYFGRYSEEKGIEILLKVCEKLSEISFIFAGDGPLKEQLEKLKNVQNIGFLNGDELETVIAQAKFAIVPSIWYENCPFTIIEAQRLGTPIVASDLGGIPELIDIGKTGEVFEAGNEEQLERKILELWNDKEKCMMYSKNCLEKKFDSLEDYCKKLIEIYLDNYNGNDCR